VLLTILSVQNSWVQNSTVGREGRDQTAKTNNLCRRLLDQFRRTCFRTCAKAGARV